MALKNYLIALSLLVLASCEPTTSTVIETQYVEKNITKATRPEPIKLNDVIWKVLVYDDKVYYGLSVQDYSVLAINMLEIKRYLQQQKNIIIYYENSIGE